MTICFLFPWRSFALHWPQVQPRRGWQEGSAGSRFPTCCSPLCWTSQTSVIQVGGNPSLASSSHRPVLCCWGTVHPPWSQPTEVNPLRSVHGGQWCWGCTGRSGPSPPLQLPLALLPGLHRSALFRTAHRTAARTCGLAAPSPGGSQPRGTAAGARGWSTGGWQWDGRTDGRRDGWVFNSPRSLISRWFPSHPVSTLFSIRPLLPPPLLSPLLLPLSSGGKAFFLNPFGLSAAIPRRWIEEGLGGRGFLSVTGCAAPACCPPPRAPEPGTRGDARSRRRPLAAGTGAGASGGKKGCAGGRAGGQAAAQTPAKPGAGEGFTPPPPPPPPSAADKSARLSRRLPRRPAEDARRRGAGGGRRAGLAALAAAPRSAPQPRGGDPRWCPSRGAVSALAPRHSETAAPPVAPSAAPATQMLMKCRHSLLSN